MNGIVHTQQASRPSYSTPETEPVESLVLPGLGYGFTVIARAIARHLRALLKRPTPTH